MNPIAARVGSNDRAFRSEIVKLRDDRLLQLQVLWNALFSCKKMLGIFHSEMADLDNQPGIFQYRLQRIRVRGFDLPPCPRVTGLCSPKLVYILQAVLELLSLKINQRDISPFTGPLQASLS